MTASSNRIETSPPSRYSWIHGGVSVVLIALVIICLAGLPGLRFDDDLENLFRGDSSEFQEYEKFTQRFGSTDRRCVVLLQCPDVLERQKLQAIRRIDTALESIPETDHVDSLGSLLEAKRVGRIFFPIVPFDESNNIAWDPAEKLLKEHPFGSGIQFSKDQQYTLISITLNDDVTPQNVEGVREQIEQVLRREWNGTGGEFYEYGITGLPIIRSEITRCLQRDQLKFTLLGLVFAVVIGWGLFRKLVPVILLAVIPFAGLGCIMGILGWLNIPLNIVNNVVTPLVLVIGFAEVIHILFSVGGRIGMGQGHREAIVATVRQLFLPCLLAALTTAIGFGSLFLAEDRSLQEFAIVASVSSLIMFAIVLVASGCILGTPLAKFCVRNRVGVSESEKAGNRVDRVFRLSPKVVSIASILAVLFMGYGASFNHFDYRYTENLPKSNDAVETIRKLDQAFGGSSPNHVILEFKEQPELDKLFEILRQVQRRLENLDTIRETVSFMDLLDSMPPDSGSDREHFGELRYLPKNAREAFLVIRPTVANIHLSLPDSGSFELLPVIDEIQSELDQVSREYPEVNATLTGLNVLSVKRSQAMIHDLVNSLLGASLVIFGLVVLVYRSLVFALAAIIVNAFPILGVAAVMYLMDQPIQYTGIMLLCTCLGLAVDDTVHFLSQTQLQIKAGMDFDSAVIQSARKLWPVLVTTSLLLGVGFGLAATSDIPTFQTFGGYACLALALALVGDLLILPYLLIFFKDYVERKRNN